MNWIMFKLFLLLQYLGIALLPRAKTTPLITLDPTHCSSGRVYLSGITEQHPHHVTYSGVYVNQTSSTNQGPVYKHDRRNHYIYALVKGPYEPCHWVVGSEVDSMDVAMRIANHSVWSLWNNHTSSWVTARTVRLQCVQDDFVTCSSGRLRVSGMEHPRFSSQTSHLGEYRLTNETRSLRPVYEHALSGRAFLFSMDGMWWIGPNHVSNAFWMFSQDSAWLPEHITHDWVVDTGRYMDVDKSFSIKCIPHILSGQESTDSNSKELSSESTNVRKPSNKKTTTTSSSSLLSSLQTSVKTFLLKSSSSHDRGLCHEGSVRGSTEPACMNGGLCIESKDLEGGYYCTCPPPYFGSRCQTEITCQPALPQYRELVVVTTTGHSVLDVVFLRCAGNNQKMDGSPGVTCKPDGTWSRAPECGTSAHLITPQDGSLNSV